MLLISCLFICELIKFIFKAVTDERLNIKRIANMMRDSYKNHLILNYQDDVSTYNSYVLIYVNHFEDNKNHH